MVGGRDAVVAMGVLKLCLPAVLKIDPLFNLDCVDLGPSVFVVTGRLGKVVLLPGRSVSICKRLGLGVLTSLTAFGLGLIDETLRRGGRVTDSCLIVGEGRDWGVFGRLLEGWGVLGLFLDGLPTFESTIACREGGAGRDCSLTLSLLFLLMLAVGIELGLLTELIDPVLLLPELLDLGCSLLTVVLPVSNPDPMRSLESRSTPS